MLNLQQARAEHVKRKGLFSVITRKFMQIKVTKSNFR